MKVPVGYYVLGIQVRDISSVDSIYSTVIDRWSAQALTMLEAGQSITWHETIMKVTKCFTVHSWGFCKLKHAMIGNREFQQFNGALFIDADHVAEIGFQLSVTVEAMNPEEMLG